MTPKAPITVIIPTYNEERNVARSLSSVSWADQVFVFDSFSTDGTLGIAEEYGATVVQRKFDNFSDHKNWALDNLPVDHNWILLLDADEVVTDALEKEILDVIQNEGPAVGYFIPRKNYFADQWIRHADRYPDFNLRLFQAGKCRYEPRLVHEHMVPDGPVGYLKNPLDHFDYKGIEWFIEKHNKYSSLEAVVLESGNEINDAGPQAKWFGTNTERRRALKQFAYRFLPARPLFVFVWMYFIKLGFLDGRIGLRYCILRGIYEYQIDLKRVELRDKNSVLRQKYSDHFTLKN